MSWFSFFTIATPAALVAAAALLRTHVIDRRRLFLDVTDRLIQEDAQRGRRMLYDKADQQWWHTASDEEIDRINRAIAVLDIASYYYSNHYISRRAFQQIWGIAVVRVWVAAAPFVTWRREMEGSRVFQHLERAHGSLTASLSISPDGSRIRPPSRRGSGQADLAESPPRDHGSR
ncbi:MAG: hypothetical protein KDB63_03420 [Nocardioidaceae bacterium]|nr:hypothetical protein [Nocardioidaceae bacterium]